MYLRELSIITWIYFTSSFIRAKNTWRKAYCYYPIMNLLKYDTRVWRFDSRCYINPFFSCLITICPYIWRNKVYHSVYCVLNHFYHVIYSIYNKDYKHVFNVNTYSYEDLDIKTQLSTKHYIDLRTVCNLVSVIPSVLSMWLAQTDLNR